MDWVKLAVRYYADPKIATLDESAELMFVRGLARAGEEAAEGFIPEHALPELARRRRHAALVDALVNAGLWSPVPGGYQIVRWSDWNGELDALARRRAADRERQRRRRAAERSKNSGHVTNGNGHVTPETLSRDKRDLSRVEVEEDQDRDTTPNSRSTRGLSSDEYPQAVDITSRLAQRAAAIAENGSR